MVPGNYIKYKHICRMLQDEHIRLKKIQFKVKRPLCFQKPNEQFPTVKRNRKRHMELPSKVNLNKALTRSFQEYYGKRTFETG